MIANPNRVVLEEALAQEAIEDGDKDASPLRNKITVKRFPYNPDAEVDTMVRTVSSSLTEVDAVLMERAHRGAPYRQVHYPNFAAFMESKQVRKRVLDHMEGRDLRDLNARLREHVAHDPRKGVQRALQRRLREHTNHTTGPGNSQYDMGLYPDEFNTTGYGQRTVFPIQDTVLPSLNSPHAKQQLFMDYLDMHRKSWEAATRNPIGKRICDLIPQFVLGRGLVCTVDNAKHQLAWDQHWQRNRMRWRIRQILKELLIYGEVFLRYFDTKDGLLVRSLDPSTIWDILTDPDDIEAVDFYHQQYTMMTNSPVAYRYRSPTLVPSQLIIRQIPGTQIDHFKINSTSSEKRGRSQLYTILGWLLRFKEFCNDRVLQNKMRAMFSLDVTVKSGDPNDMLTVEELFNQPPAPGSVLIHNDAVELEFKNANVNAADTAKDADMLLKVIALGSGVSEAFLGVSSSSTRAGALIQTEPDVKNFETYQEIVEDILGASYERIRIKHKLEPTRSRFEVTFPALAQEDRSAKLKDIAMAESMDYFSKARAASMAAKEFGVTGYNYEIERQQIMEERALTPMMAKGMEQMPKITQDPASGGGLTDGPPPGTPGPVPNPTKGENEGVTQTSGEMGFSATNLSGRGLANTQATLNRSGFTRGGEKNNLARQSSTGTPLKASAESPVPRNVWSDRARAAALATRRANRARRDALKKPEE